MSDEVKTVEAEAAPEAPKPDMKELISKRYNEVCAGYGDAVYRLQDLQKHVDKLKAELDQLQIEFAKVSK